MKPEENVGHLLSMSKMTLSTAESCTGGGVAAAVTSVPGSSEYFKGGVVAYSNEVKMSLLHVSPATLERHGAVSRETVIEMAQGIRQLLHTDCAIATSGIAGPGGGTPVKPVGTIWIAVICKNEISTRMLTGDHGRSENVRRTIENTLSMLYSQLEQGKNTIIQ